MTELGKRMIEALQLRGLSERTQEMWVCPTYSTWSARFPGVNDGRSSRDT
jgi:hypothetical protein